MTEEEFFRRLVEALNEGYIPTRDEEILLEIKEEEYNENI